jgi:hypothetical protein
VIQFFARSNDKTAREALQHYAFLASAEFCEYTCPSSWNKAVHRDSPMRQQWLAADDAEHQRCIDFKAYSPVKIADVRARGEFPMITPLLVLSAFQLPAQQLESTNAITSSPSLVVSCNRSSRDTHAPASWIQERDFLGESGFFGREIESVKICPVFGQHEPP